MVLSINWDHPELTTMGRLGADYSGRHMRGAGWEGRRVVIYPIHHSCLIVCYE